MSDPDTFLSSPLSLEALKKIESTQLSSFERHHLRLMAHCLGWLQQMAGDSTKGAFPVESNRLKWCLAHPFLAKERVFVPVLLKQLSVIEQELLELAESSGLSPLELTVDDLIEASIEGKKS